MARIIHMTVFFTLIILIFILAHYYCYNRISYYFGLSVNARKVFAVTLGFIAICTFFCIPLIRTVQPELAKPIAFIVFPWFGILLLMFVSCFVGDLVTGAVFLSFDQSLQDHSRRTFIKQLIGLAVVGTTGGLSALSLKNGLRAAKVKQVPIYLKRLPEAFNGFHIAQITDLHISPATINGWLEHVVERTNALGADMIAITGDLIDGSVEELGAVVKELGKLRAKHGVYFITGNHEYYSGADEWVAYIKALGIRVLTNEHVPITQHGQTIDLAGTEDINSHNFPGHGEDLQKALNGRDENRAVILLAHQPATVIEAASRNVDLQLSGHTHGGQIRPFDYLVRIRQPYVAGLHQHPDSNTQIYVSSGTGYWGPPMRLGTSAEITSIKLYKSA